MTFQQVWAIIKCFITYVHYSIRKYIRQGIYSEKIYDQNR